MRDSFFTIPGEWSGRLIVSPRPRGGDWLADEIRAWRRVNVELVLSLLTPSEEQELDLTAEAELCRSNGIEFLGFPVVDRGTPPSDVAFSGVIQTLWEQLKGGATVLVHCRQGIGRAGLVALGLLLRQGLPLANAEQVATAARGLRVPETDEQRQWVERFSKASPRTAA